MIGMSAILYTRTRTHTQQFKIGAVHCTLRKMETMKIPSRPLASFTLAEWRRSWLKFYQYSIYRKKRSRRKLYGKWAAFNGINHQRSRDAMPFSACLLLLLFHFYIVMVMHACFLSLSNRRPYTHTHRTCLYRADVKKQAGFLFDSSFQWKWNVCCRPISFAQKWISFGPPATGLTQCVHSRLTLTTSCYRIFKKQTF